MVLKFAKSLMQCYLSAIDNFFENFFTLGRRYFG